MMSCDNRHASGWLSGDSIRETYKGVGCEFRPKDIVADIQKARELALGSIRGSPEESYNTLPSYCYVLEQKILVPLLIYKVLRTLFITVCKDGNNKIYPLAFGIDRHGSIEKAVHKVFPHARHGVYTYHVGQNLKTKFKNSAIHKLFHDAAHAYRVSEFNFIFGQLEIIDPRAARYLMDIGVDQWACSYSTGKRYNIKTIGIVESLNTVLKNARDLPVLQLFVTHQQRAMLMSTKLTLWADGELHSRYNMSATYLVEPINSKECNVKYAGISAQCIYPTGNEIDWVIPNHICNKVVLPPKTRHPTGRLRKVRIPYGGEGKCTSHCNRCGKYGHNKKTCK
ncbi:hypothetical protein AAG906_026872 [Vitis piasezkii]